MSTTLVNVPSPHSEGTFRVARILALQPRMSVANIEEDVMATNDPSVLSAVTNLIRVWAWKHAQVPFDFCEKVTVAGVSRQPVVYAAVDLQRCERRCEPVVGPLAPDREVDATPWP